MNLEMTGPEPHCYLPLVWPPNFAVDVPVSDRATAHEVSLFFLFPLQYHLNSVIPVRFESLRNELTIATQSVAV